MGTGTPIPHVIQAVLCSPRAVVQLPPCEGESGKEATSSGRTSVTGLAEALSVGDDRAKAARGQGSAG